MIQLCIFNATNAANATSTEANNANPETTPDSVVHPSTPPATVAGKQCNANPPHTITTLNIAGLIPYKFRGKVKLLAETAHTDNTLILSLTESHLTQNIKDAEINIDNYTSFRTDRSDNRKKGGIISYIKSRYAAHTKVLLSESNSYTEAQVLNIVPMNIIYITIYRPPACPTNKFMDPLNKVREILATLPTPMPTIFLTGDLNFPLINWELESVYGGTEEMRTQAEALLNLAREFCLEQHINTPTRGDNILDIVMTNDDNLIHTISVNKTNLSDHNIISLTTNIITDTRFAAHAAKKPMTVNFNKLNFFNDKISWEAIKKELDEVDWAPQLRDLDPEAQYNKILKLCLDISKNHVPLRKSSSQKNNPRDRRILMCKRSRLRTKFKSNTRASLKQRTEAQIACID